MIDQRELERVLNSLQYVLECGENRSFAVDMVEFSTDDKYSSPISMTSDKGKNVKAFKKNMQELISTTKPHAVRICLFEKKNQIDSKILRINDNSPILAFGEKPALPAVSGLGNYYDEGPVLQLQQKFDALAGLMEQKDNDMNAKLNERIKEIERENEKKDWEREKKDLESQIAELNDELFDYEEDNTKLEGRILELQNKLDSLKQFGLLAGIGLVKGGKTENLLQLAGLFLGGDGSGASGIDASMLTGKEDATANPEKNEEEISEEATIRKKNEAAIYSWMRSLDELNFQKFAHIINAIMTQSDIIDRFARLLVRDQEAAVKKEAEQ